MHLQQYIVQQESTTTNLVDHHLDLRQQTSMIYLLQMIPATLGPDLVDISVETGILQVATSISKKEQQLQEDLIKPTVVELQDFYEEELSQYT